MLDDMYEFFEMCKNLGSYFCLEKLEIGDFSKIDELCQNEGLWSNNFQMALYSW
jgi:hypothetical protein